MKATKILIFLKCIRIHQWIKNGFIFMPIFFAGKLFEGENLLLCLIGFFSFSLFASSIYIINDIKDIESDRQHPTKKHRPIAASLISKPKAILISVLLLVLGLSLAFFTKPSFLFLALFYYVLNLLYAFYLKHISILDVTIISLGFVLRVIAGGVLCNVEISQWLYIMTFLLAFFLAVAKRRDDLVIRENEDLKIRKVIDNYSLDFVNVLMGVLSAVIIVAYLLYITSPEITHRFPDQKVFISSIFVFLGIVRYLQITIVEKKSGSPTNIVFKDFFIQLNIILWLLFFLFNIYFNHGYK